ncbi:hypothetical protein GCM10010174_27070 [Kutzneria viridogrisea]|uniref:Nucleotide-binding universal stress UspA family protein n=1 Tax=Kutzneria viridogrisea TaxID=47990 RepID=A0ABR6BVI4_9PSEU|nr:nucleotide-binding universal stress UspA family protein [Kutzneria viridogrisea]
MTDTVLAGMTLPHHPPAMVMWAAEYAARTGNPLRVILSRAGRCNPDPAMRAVRSAVAGVGARYPAPPLRLTLDPRPLFSAFADVPDAGLVLVDRDAHRWSAIRGLATRRAGPVAAVGADSWWPQKVQPLLVGTDGTASSEPALEWAFAAAGRLGCGVRVVFSPAAATESAKLRESMLTTVTALTAHHRALDVRLHSRDSSLLEALSWHSQSASMTVLGPRNGTGTAAAEHMLLRSNCAIVLVPQRGADATANRSTMDSRVLPRHA